MSDEQSIRDELAQVIDKEAATYEPVTGFGGTHEPLTLAEGSDMAERIADAILASPVIRRAQAEALRGAADDINARRNGHELIAAADRWGGYYSGVRTGMENEESALRNRADRIEQNSEGNET